MMGFNTGLSALRANQTALSVTGHNIANASTSGYHRQSVYFTENPSVEIGGHLIGTGVSVESIRRARNAAAEEALTNSITQGAGAAARLDLARQAESLFLRDTGSLPERVESFFNDLQRLSAEPNNTARRQTVIRSAKGLADELNRVDRRLDELVLGSGQEVEQVVADIRAKSQQVAELNQRIATQVARGKSPHDLLDQRDRLVNELAEYIDVRRQVSDDGRESFVLGGLWILDTEPVEITVKRGEGGLLEVWKEGCDEPAHLQDGKLAALVGSDGQGGYIGELRAQLREFTQSFIARVDAAHAFGVGIGKDFDSLRGQRTVQDAGVPLNNADPATPLQAGSLFVSVTDQASGYSTLSEIQIDPDMRSLQDVAAAIGAIDHVGATVDATGGMLIVAENGYSFDFTGNLTTFPDTGSLTGTTTPAISGRYTGSRNDQWTYTFSGDGAVGVDPGLRLEVRDGGGAVVNLLNVGSDYEPGTNLLVADGVQLALSSGAANDGDSFVTQVVARPDETNFLAAMGLNTLFAGHDAGDIEVNPTLVADPNRLATTTNGDPSDTSNLLRMLAVRDARSVDDNRTLEEALADLVSSVGREVADLTQLQRNNEDLRQTLRQEIDAASGVDMNEELANMLQYQRAFQAASQYISVVDESLQELINMLR